MDYADIIHAWGNSGLYGQSVLGGIFVLSGLIWIPRQPLCVVGGLVFGMAAVPVVLIGSTVGAIVALLASRVLFRNAMLRVVQKRRLGAAVVRAVQVEGWRIVFLLRLASPIPGIVTNYACGLTNISLSTYTIATVAGLLPQTLLFVYLGVAGKAVLSSANSSLQTFLMLASIIVTVMIVVIVKKSTKKLLETSPFETSSGDLGGTATKEDRGGA
jgi:uncharacterized membrane protein YdjX (TVP38/TMEM64 family)